MTPEEGTPKSREDLLRASSATLGLRIQKARTDFATFYELCWYTPRGEQISLQPFHRQWIDALLQHQRVLLLASRNHGKCMVAGSLIFSADGRRIPIEEWQGGDVVAFDPENLKLVPAPAGAAFYNGQQACLRVRTRTGRSETVTRNHKFALLTEWRTAEDLQVGDRIAVPKTLPYREPATSSFAAHEAWLLGLYVGDGSCLGGRPRLSVGDAVVRQAVVEASAALGMAFSCAWNARGTATDIRYIDRGSTRAPKAWLAQYDLTGCTAIAKRVPAAVFSDRLAEIGEFLAGYFDADGHASRHAGGMAEFYSISEMLLRDIQHLLTRLGVVAVLSRKRGLYKGERHLSWRLTVRGADLVRMAERVPLRSSKALVLREIAARQVAQRSKSTVDSFPREIYAMLPYGAGWCQQRGLPRPCTQYVLSRRKALVLAQAMCAKRVQDLAEAEILWDEIVEITDVGVQPTWGIEVPGYHSYVGQDVINHNSELLSALVLWELGREPSRRIKIACQSDNRAQGLLNSIKSHLTKNPLIKLVFPELERDPAGRWTNTQVDVRHPGATRDPSIHALGVLSTVVGGRADIILFDDPMDFRMSILQPKTRDAAVGKVFAEWMPTLEPDGKLWVVMTPWSRLDLSGKLRNRPGWHNVTTAVGTDEDPFKPLWPTRFSREYLMQLREALGPIDYDRAYRLKITSDDVVPVRPHWIHYYDDKLLGNPDDYYCVVSFDLAISQASTADYFACVVVLYDQARNLSFVVDAWHGRYTFAEQVSLVLSTAQEWNADRVVIEKAMYEGALAQQVEDLASWPIPVVTVKPKVKKERRLIEVTPRLENERVYFHPKMNPKGRTSEDFAELSRRGDLVTELCEFPNGEHDDLSDAYVQAEQSLRELGASAQAGGGAQINVATYAF